MVVRDRMRLFGHIDGSTKGRKGTNEAPHMVLSELGKRIIEQEIPTHLTAVYQQEHARLLRIAEEGTVLVTSGIMPVKSVRQQSCAFLTIRS